MKIYALILAVQLSTLFSAAGEFAEPGEDQLKGVKPPAPQQQLHVTGPEAPSGISLYSTDEVFTFERDAEKAAEERAALFRGFGLTVLGSNVTEKDNDYTFNIEYSPLLKNPENIKAVLLKEYAPAKSYWTGNLAKEALNSALVNFKNTPLRVLDSILTEDGDYSFSVSYAVNNLLQKGRPYYAKFGKTVYGRYTFESQAAKDAPSVLARFRQNGIPAVKAKTVSSGNDYALEVEFLKKTDNGKERPEYSVENYRCGEKFTFENGALKEALARNAVFAKAGLRTLHVYAFENGGDYSFAVDYAVKNLYRKEGVFREFEIKTYQNPETFDFESAAKKALEAKKANFDAAGLYVISSGVYEAGNDYSFYLEYLEKQNAQPVPRAPKP